MKTKRDHHQLIHDWIHGEISSEDFQRLQDLLLKDPEARRLLRHEVNLDMVLRDHASMDASLNSWLPKNQNSKITNLRPFIRPWMPWAAAASIAALLSAGFFFSPTSPGRLQAAKAEETSQGAAILTRMVNVKWTDENRTPRSGDTLGTGTFKLASGLAQIEFFSGATLLVDGPAEIEIHSAWKATCHSGKVRARVPPPAQGFVINTPAMEVEDLGTEFGVEVNPADHSTEVHVFEGEVNARPKAKNSKLVLLHEGEGLRHCSAGLTQLASVRPEDFVCLERMDVLTQNRAKNRFAQWKEWKKQYCADPRILACYTFQRSCNWERAAGNDATKVNSFCTGGIVGARWTQGRWPEKDALEFKRPGDRVRIRLSGEYEGLTFACWLKVDGLDRKYNALLLTDGYEHGEPHWQILEDGRVMFSIAPPPQPNGDDTEAQAYYTPVVFTQSNLGRWHHLAVTYDAISGETVQYFDGRQVSRETPSRQPPGCSVVYGPCEIGNWGLPAAGHQAPIRNLNGCIDEFVIYKDSLKSSELLTLYQAGRQD